MDTVISKHARERSKERTGIKKKSFERLLPKILKEGKTTKDFNGSFRRYLDKLHMSHSGKKRFIIFGHRIYVLKNKTIVTVMLIPSEFLKIVDKVNKNDKIND